MKIGVISDTHGYDIRVGLAIEKFFHDADLIVHAGDVLSHGPNNLNFRTTDYNPKALAERINNSKIPFVICRGNCDAEVDQMVLNTPIQAPYAYVFANNKNIIVTHGHLLPTNDAKIQMAKHLRAQIFITGHTHKTVLKKQENIIFLNPSTPSPYLTNCDDKRTSISIITDYKIQIFDLDTSEILMSLDI